MKDLLSDFIRKANMLQSLAEKDPCCIVWKKMSADAKKDYDRLMRFLPRKVQQVISNYVSAEVSLANSEKALALRYMDFLPKLRGK